MKSRISLHGLAILLALITSCSNSATNKDTFNTELTAGFNLLPVPQQVSFSGNYFTIGNDWTLESGNKLTGESKAVSSLLAGLKELGGPEIKSGLQEEANLRRRHFIRLSILPGSVHPLASTDTNSAAIEEQAYRLNLDASGIIINANAPQGLFYGVQTLLQLMRTKNGKVILPEGEITDWPDLELRMIYWDCAHHLERMEAFKHAIRQAAYYKINAIALKLEGHFQFESAEPVVEPYALTPAEYQELTDYAMDNFVQLTPYLDAPAHVSFILKHPEYKSLREFPNINYEFSVTDPKAEELITGMFNDLISANRGVKYIHLSTDEAYYVGKSAVEKKAAEAMGGNGKLLADFITRISDRLHENGRTVIFWGEYPLTLPDIEALPAHLVNGEYNEDWASAFKNKGIRQLIYISTQGVEPLFPNYYRLKERLTSEASETPVKSDDEEQQPDASKGRVGEMLKTIQTDIRAGNSDFMGVIVAAWGDAGLHTETFWLGYAAGCSAAWNTDPVSADELSDRFFNSFYGPEAVKMKRVYQLLSTQAEFWRNSWRQVPSQLRTPVLGNSKGLYDKPRPARDQSLPMLPVPSGNDLSINEDWSNENSGLLNEMKTFKKENDELVDLLNQNLKKVKNQQYNIRILLSVAQLCRHNLNFLAELHTIDSLLKISSGEASANQAKAISYIDQALDRIQIIKQQRDDLLTSTTELWNRDWFPRVSEANGRIFLDQVDDIKDHLPVRTVDMSYLIYRELHFPLGKWAEDVRNSRNQFAKENQLPERTEVIDF